MATTAHTLTKTAYTAIVSTAGSVSVLFSDRARRAGWVLDIELIIATSAPTVPTNADIPRDEGIVMRATDVDAFTGLSIADGETLYARWLSEALPVAADMKIVTL